MIYYRSTDGGGEPSHGLVGGIRRLPTTCRCVCGRRRDYPQFGQGGSRSESIVNRRVSRDAPRSAMVCTPSVAVNGQPVADPVKPGGWRDRRSGSRATSWTLEMPMKTRLALQVAGRKGGCDAGPMVFCFSPSRQAGRYPVYAGKSGNPAEIQQAVTEAIPPNEVRSGFACRAGIGQNHPSRWRGDGAPGGHKAIEQAGRI